MQSLMGNINIKRVAVFTIFAAAIFWIGFCFGTGVSQTDILKDMRGFTLILWSILFEALPFVMLGIIVSSLIHVFVTEEMILKIMPDNKFMRLVFSALIGLVFPVCECAIIPITRGLIKKGMPTGPAITFMLATPIVNPIVLLSTYNAFSSMPEMTLLRAGTGFIGAIVIGALVSSAHAKEVLKTGKTPSCSCGMHHGDEADNAHTHNDKRTKQGIFLEVLRHTNTELQSVGMYLIFGAFIAAAVQMAVPTEVLTGIGNGRIVSILVMMALAFLLSLCSEADAFIANTFLYQFSGASVLVFLIVGPMIDLKNTFMMFGSFQKKFTMRLILTITLVCFALAFIASFLIGGLYG